MCQIFTADPRLAVKFLEGILADPEEFGEIMLEATDNTSRMYVAQLIKFLLCQVKMIEKDLIMNDALTGEHEEQKKASVACRFIDFMVGELNQRVARSWARMEEYLEVLYAFGVYGPEEILAGGHGVTEAEPVTEGEAFKIGMTYYFRIHMVEKIGDFLLGDKSPFLKEGETRPTMGGSYT
jgi:hypothetical protein